MLHPKKFIKKTTKFERWQKKSPEMARIWEDVERELRPEKYLDCGLELLHVPKLMKKEIKEIYYSLKPHFSSLRGGSHPMPHLTGIIYMAYKNTVFPLKREVIANAFGTNVDVITKGYQEIRSFYLSQQLSKNNLIVKCPRCYEVMNLENSFWKCKNHIHSEYIYGLSKNFIRLNVKKSIIFSSLSKLSWVDVLPMS